MIRKESRPIALHIPVLCALLLWPVSGLAGESEISPQPEPAKVTTEIVRQCNCLRRGQVVGTVEAAQRAAIAAKISGVIVELPVVLGSRVQQGDLLVRMNAQEITAKVLRAKAQLAQARRNLAREEKLLRQHASTPETVKAMRDMLAIAEAGLREAKSMLAYTVIKAPFPGLITRKIANVGDLATPGMPLLKLENPDHLQIVTAIPEAKAGDVHLKTSLEVTIPAAGLKLSGTVTELSLSVDPHSRTMPIKIDLPSTSLKTGMFARITLPGRPDPAIMISERAIVPFGQLNKVFVVEKGKAWLRLVRTGRHQGDSVEILAGLDPGERIVVENNRLLVNGQPLLLDQVPSDSDK